jgi:hypothetical protein
LDWPLRSDIIAETATETEPVVRPAREFTTCFTLHFTTERRAQHIFGRAVEPASERNRS